jgi:hypothetical protein
MTKVYCRNKLCKLFNINYLMHCGALKQGSTEVFVNWCPMRKVYAKVSKRIAHDAYIRGVGKKSWNKYQISKKKNLNGNT